MAQGGEHIVRLLSMYVVRWGSLAVPLAHQARENDLGALDGFPAPASQRSSTYSTQLNSSIQWGAARKRTEKQERGAPAM